MMTTATTTTKTLAVMPAPSSKSTTISSIPVRAIPIPNTNKLILAGPCIVLRAATVAEQVQALRQSKKVTATTASLKTESTVEEPLRCKKRAGLGKLGLPEVKPLMSRRNARERNRVKLVNQGFDTLRQRVPGGKKNRKMSKVDTLKSAIDYIRSMGEMIREHDEKMKNFPGNPAEKSTLNNNQCSVNVSVPMSTEEIMLETHQREENTRVVPTSVKSFAENENDAINLPVSVATSTPMETSTAGVGALDSATVATTEKMNIDNITNNNNNTFINFNTEKCEKSSSRAPETNPLHAGSRVNVLPKLDNVQKMNSEQRNQVNNVLLLNGVSAVSTTNMNTSGLMSLTSSAGTVTSMMPQTITLITLPLQQNVPLQQNALHLQQNVCLQQNLPYSSDDVFLTDSQQQILTSSHLNAITECRFPTSETSHKTTSSNSSSNNNENNCINTTSANSNNNKNVISSNNKNSKGGNNSSRSRSTSSGRPTAVAGNGTRLTTLGGLGSLSGQSFSLNQPCRRYLSFSESESHHLSSIPHKLLLSEPIQTLLRTAQKQQQGEQSQQAAKPQSSFSLPPGNSVPTSEKSVDGNGVTSFSSPTPMEQQQLEDSQQNPEQPVYTTLANVFLPKRSASAVLSLDQSTNTNTFSTTDNQTHCYQRLVATGNTSTKQPQVRVDQEVPSPSLSTSSSQTSESSYESYESLGSLEEDLQDLSDWIMELCKSAIDINADGATDANCTDFLAYNHDLL